MSATEGKYLAHRFVHAANVFGIVPALLLPSLTSWPINANSDVFPNAVPVSDFGADVRRLSPGDALARVRKQLPVLRNAPVLGFGRRWVAFIHSFTDVHVGNPAVYHLVSRFAAGTFPGAPKVSARRNMARAAVSGIARGHGPAAMLRGDQFAESLQSVLPDDTEVRWDTYSDFGKELLHRLRTRQYAEGGRSWGRSARRNFPRGYELGIEPEQALLLGAVTDPPSFASPLLRSRQSRESRFTIHACKGYIFIWVHGTHDVCVPEGTVDIGLLATNRGGFSANTSDKEAVQKWERRSGRKLKQVSSPVERLFFPTRGRRAGKAEGREVVSTATRGQARDQTAGKAKSERGGSLYIFTERDLQDLVFLTATHARDLQYRRSMQTRVFSDDGQEQVYEVIRAMDSLKLAVWKMGSRSDFHAARVGVYWDMIEALVHSNHAGNRFLDHRKQNLGRIEKHGLEDFPAPHDMVAMLSKVAPELAQEVLAQSRLALYPELDGFGVVSEQYELHSNPLKTDYEAGTPEALRVEQTRNYLWYYVVLILHDASPGEVYPGKIREGVEEKPWHAKYLTEGIPGSRWMDGCDVDLSGAFPITPLKNSAYVEAADSSCLPSRPEFLQNFESYRGAPAYEKKKIEYLLKAPNQVDLGEAWDEMLQTEPPENLKDKSTYTPAFTTACGTGTRFERKKRSGRPFYSQSAPFAPMTSHINSHARDLLQLSKQSLFGASKATRSTSMGDILSRNNPRATMVNISDDKEKYSVQMDDNSQLMLAELQAEIAGEPGLVNHIQQLLQGELIYRVHGHLVRYSSNGTDREGLRAGLNTLLEIVVQGLSSRLCQDRGLLVSAVYYQAFIDDALRRLPVAGKTVAEVNKNLAAVMDDIVFGQRVMGRKMSWDKAFVSTSFATILGEIWHDGTWVPAGLKAFALFGETEVDEAPVMTAAAWESLFFSKAQGARSSGAPLDLSYSQYVFETLHVMARSSRHPLQEFQACPHAITALSLVPQFAGGWGLRTPLQIETPESAVSSQESLSTFQRAVRNDASLAPYLVAALQAPIRVLSKGEMIRNPMTLSFDVPRTQPGRVVAAMRDAVQKSVTSPFARSMMAEARRSEEHLQAFLEIALLADEFSAAETLDLYRASALRATDEFITKIASSDIARTLLGKDGLRSQRLMARRDDRKMWSRWIDVGAEVGG